MSVLNRPSDGQPNVLLALARTLWAHDGKAIPKDELLNRVGSDALGDIDKRARKTLSCWHALGLFSETQNGVVSFASKLAASQKPKTLAWLRVAAREVAFRQENNAPLWPQNEGEEKGKAADLTRGIAWLLAQAHSERLAGYPAAEVLARAQFGNARAMIQNSTRWGPLKDWMRFLGFAVGGKVEARSPAQRTSEDILIPDPTQAIADVLPLVLSTAAALPVAEFLRRLAEEIPVIDSGAFRVEIENQVVKSHRPDPNLKLLSPSLSRALKRLEFQHLIRLAMLSDAPETYSLQFGAGGRQTFTHLALSGGML